MTEQDFHATSPAPKVLTQRRSAKTSAHLARKEAKGTPRTDVPQGGNWTPLVLGLVLAVGCGPPSEHVTSPQQTTVRESLARKERSPVKPLDAQPLRDPGVVDSSPARSLIVTGRPRLEVRTFEDGPTQVVVFDLVNAGRVPVKSALVDVQVKDVRGNAVKITGEGRECQFGPPLMPGRSAPQIIPVPRWLQGLRDASSVEVLVLRTH